MPKSKYVGLMAATLLCLAGLVSAQSTPANSLSSNNVFIGYSFMGSNLFSGEHANLNGWNASVEKKYLPFFGVIADFSGLYGSKALPPTTPCAGNPAAPCLVNSSISEYTFQAGIRGSYAARKVRPFAELLFGAVHTSENGPGLSNSDHRFSATLGGGLDCRLVGRLGCRLDVDYIVTGTFNPNVRQNSVRASSGLVYRF